MLGLVVVMWFLLASLATADVADDGAFVTTVPVAVPGFHGLQPKLALTYSSGQGNGPYGMGWSLSGLSQITRVQGQSGVPRWDDSDSYMLDGTRLVRCSLGTPTVLASPSCGAEAVAGLAAFTTEIESYQRVGYGSGDDVWTVWRRDGVVLKYRAVRVTDRGTVDWRLSTAADLSGNTVTYQWSHESGLAPALDSISYDNVRITFVSETRPDIVPARIGNAVFDEKVRIRAIRVTAGPSLLRSYHLRYHSARADEPATSVLASVQLFGSDDKTAAPQTTYTTTSVTPVSWAAGQKTMLSSADARASDSDAPVSTTLGGAATDQVNWSDGGSWIPANLNGDPATDLLRVSTPAAKTPSPGQMDDYRILVEVEMPRSEGGYEHVRTWLAPDVPTDGLPRFRVAVGDLTGDGVDDLVFGVPMAVRGFPTVQIRLYEAVGSATGTFALRNDQSLPDVPDGTGQPLVGDVTGDGKADLVMELGSSTCQGRGGVETIADSQVRTACWPAGSRPGHLQLADVNGDRISDVLGEIYASDTSSFKVVTAVAVGQGSLKAAVWDTRQSWGDQTQGDDGQLCTGYGDIVSKHWSENSPTLVADFDGDGRTDVAVLVSGKFGEVAKVLRSNGDGTFAPSEDWTTPFNSGLEQTRWTVHLHCQGGENGPDPEGTPGTPVYQSWPADVIAADIDGDEAADLISLDNAGDTIGHPVLAMSDHAGDFHARFTSAHSWRAPCANAGCRRPTSIVADVTGDGALDIVVASSETSSGPTILNVLPTPPQAQREHPVAADTNGDGNADLVRITQIDSSTLVAHTDLGHADGSYSSRPEVHVTSSVMRQSWPTTGWMPGDFNGDGLDDLVNLPGGARTGLVLLSTGDGGWTAVGTTLQALDWSLQPPDGLVALRPRDPDPGDPHPGKPERPGPGDPDPRRPPRPIPHSVRYPTGSWFPADVNNDGATDFVHVGSAPPQALGGPGVLVLFGNRGGQLLSPEWRPMPGQVSASTPGWVATDVNGDQGDDLVRVDSAAGTVHTLLRQGSGWVPIEATIATTDTTPADTAPEIVKTGNDFTWLPSHLGDDPAADLVRVVAHENQLLVEVLTGHGDGQWTPTTVSVGTAGPAAMDTQNWLPTANTDGTLIRLARIATTADAARADLLTNDGAGWQLTHSKPLTLTDRTPTGWQFRLSAGHLQAARLRSTAGRQSYVATLRSTIHTRTITKINNGLGATTSIHYADAAVEAVAGISNPEECRTPSLPATPVSSITTTVHGSGQAGAHPAVAGGDLTDNSSFSYSCPRYSSSLRRVLGWQSTSTRHTSSSKRGHNPVRVDRTIQKIYDTGIAETTDQQTFDGAGHQLQYTHNTYVDPGDLPYHKTLLQTSTGRCSPNPNVRGESACTKTTTAYKSDAFGNTTEAIATASGSNRRTVTATEYVRSNDTTWLHNLPRIVTLTDPDIPSFKQAALTCYDGDTSPDCNHNQHDGTRGLVTATRQWDDGNASASWKTTATIQYDEWGNPTTVTAPGGPIAHVTTTIWDHEHHLYPLEVCNALDQCTTATGWDRTAEAPTATTALNGAVTRTTYDPLGRVAAATGPTGVITRTMYKSGSSGTAVTTTSASKATGSFWTRTLQDGLGNRYRTEHPTAKIGSDGNPAIARVDTVYVDATTAATVSSPYWKHTKPTAWTTTRTDALKRPTSVASADHSMTITTYVVRPDGYEHQTIVAANGTRKTAVLDSSGKITMILLPSLERPGANATTSYTYNAAGNPTMILDSHGNTITTTYNSLGQKTQEADPDRGMTIWTYDTAGNIHTQTDARKRTLTYSYDALNRLTHKVDNAAAGIHRDTSWTYDQWTAANRGHLTTVVDPSGDKCPEHRAHTYNYDILGNLTSDHQCTLGITANLKTSYDELGRPVIVTYPDQRAIHYRYNHPGQVRSIDGYLKAVNYDAQGRPIKFAYANATTETLGYGATTGLLDRQGVTARLRTVFDMRYTYDDSGLVTQINSTSEDQHTSYTYDTHDELRTSTDHDTHHHAIYSYDDIGNMLSNSSIGSYTYATPTCLNHQASPQCVQASNHASTRAGKTNFQYDLAGNVGTITGPGRKQRATWNTEGQLTKLIDGTNQITRTYDASGAVVAQETRAGLEVRFGSLAQHDPSGWTDRIYLGGKPVVVAHGSTKKWYVTDRQGTVRTSTDEVGKRSPRIQYTDWGASKGATADDISYGGHRALANTQLIDMVARDYDPETARMLSPDNIVPDAYDPISLNRYAYAMNAPSTMIDPTGHVPVDPTQIGAGIDWSWYKNGAGPDNSQFVVTVPMADVASYYRSPSGPQSSISYSSTPTAGTDPTGAGKPEAVGISGGNGGRSGFISRYATDDSWEEYPGAAPTPPPLVDAGPPMTDEEWMRAYPGELVNVRPPAWWREQFESGGPAVELARGVYARTWWLPTFSAAYLGGVSAIAGSATVGPVVVGSSLRAYSIASVLSIRLYIGYPRLSAIAFDGLSGLANAPSGYSSATKNLWSTGRTGAQSLTEQLAMEEVRANPGAGEMLERIKMTDGRWSYVGGWMKMQQVVKGSNWQVVVHYVYNLTTGETGDFKFK